MNNIDLYKSETRAAYQDTKRAESYKAHYTSWLSWGRITMWRERLIVDRILRVCHFGPDSRIFDMPCGTGFLGKTVSKHSSRIFAGDISMEMMALARSEYRKDAFKGFVRADITALPFIKNSFSCSIVLGFMHRVPIEVRMSALKELGSISDRYIIISYSVDTAVQRLKKRLIKIIQPSYKPAPLSISMKDILEEFRLNDLAIKKIFRVVPFFSSSVIFYLEKGA